MSYVQIDISIHYSVSTSQLFCIFCDLKARLRSLAPLHLDNDKYIFCVKDSHE